MHNCKKETEKERKVVRIGYIMEILYASDVTLRTKEMHCEILHWVDGRRKVQACVYSLRV